MRPTRLNIETFGAMPPLALTISATHDEGLIFLHQTATSWIDKLTEDEKLWEYTIASIKWYCFSMLSFGYNNMKYFLREFMKFHYLLEETYLWVVSPLKWLKSFRNDNLNLHHIFKKKNCFEEKRIKFFRKKRCLRLWLMHVLGILKMRFFSPRTLQKYDF